MNNVSFEAGGLKIDLTIPDQCVVDYIKQFPEDDRVGAVVNCIQLGARALSFVADKTETTLLTDSLKESAASAKLLLETVSEGTREAVKRASDELPKKLESVLKIVEKDLLKTLDPDSASSIVGGLQKTLATNLGREMASLKDALDLSNPRGALSNLRDGIERRQGDLDKKIAELAAQLKSNAAANAMRLKTTGKGVTFEDTLERYVADESRPLRDQVNRTSRLPGFDGNSKGDIVIEIEKAAARGHGLSVVIEAKDEKISIAALTTEVELAIRNRGAAFGIGVTTNPTITRGSSPIVPIGDNILIVCAPRIADDEFDMLAVGIALDMARWKSIMGRALPGHQMDLNRIYAHVESAINTLRGFSEAKSKMTSIKREIDRTTDFLQGLRDRIRDDLENLRGLIEEEIEDEDEPDEEAA